MPGVPHEMQRMFDDHVVPRIREIAPNDSHQIRYKTFGLPESITVGGNTYDISVTSLRYAVFGVVLIVVMIFRPQGLWPNRRRAAEIEHRKKEMVVGG